ncbi:fibronectin type III-like domain-contianing protein [Flavobacterium sp. 3HN19-14]|uniref:fibronectin type III-like domain-contianing protein n=1 Tax=Flavobacterium sp. 3HN19-14 TaxID=3448133 RepID=UPI003EE000F1
MKNTGKYDGSESAQVYVHQNNAPVERPLKELKGFTKVFLKKGETKTVTVQLDASAFSYYKVEKKTFGYDAGEFEIIIGASSEDLRLKGSVNIK